MLTHILAASIGGVVTETIRWGYERRKQQRQKVEEWYEETLSIVTNGYFLCESVTERSNLNYGDLSTSAPEISQALSQQINPHPDEIDDETVGQVEKLATLFRKVGAVASATDEQSSPDAIDELIEMGQRDIANHPDVNLGQAMDTAADYSSIMDDLFTQTEIDPTLFGTQFEDRLKDADTLNDLIDTMSSDFPGVEQQEIEELVEGELVENKWDESLSMGIRMYLQITLNLCELTINHISQVNNLRASKST